MLNLTETLETCRFYTVQTDLYLKIFLFFAAVFPVIDELRAQVSEVSLLQLIPGLYVGVIFSSYSFLICNSYLFSKFSFEIDNEKIRGTKTFDRAEIKMNAKSIGTLFSFGFYGIFLTILPISLDSFSSYGEKNIENIWSYDQFIDIETSLIVLLATILQIPLILTSRYYSETQIQLVPFYLKNYIFILCIFAGLLTPTIDALTQIGFILIGMTLYLLMNSILKKSTLRIFSF